MTANRTRDRGGEFPLWVGLGRVADAAWGRLCFLQRTIAATCRPSDAAADGHVASRPQADDRQRPLRGSLPSVRRARQSRLAIGSHPLFPNDHETNERLPAQRPVLCVSRVEDNCGRLASNWAVRVRPSRCGSESAWRVDLGSAWDVSGWDPSSKLVGWSRSAAAGSRW